jgi:tripartite-type tricarboxylate transporter receptor subunit TctC
LILFEGNYRMSVKFRSIFVGLLASLVSQVCLAQAPFPSKPVRLIVTFSPGGAADQSARLLADRLAERWKPHTVVVENIIGAGGNVGAEVVFRAPRRRSHPADGEQHPCDQPRDLQQNAV